MFNIPFSKEKPKEPGWYIYHEWGVPQIVYPDYHEIDGEQVLCVDFGRVSQRPVSKMNAWWTDRINFDLDGSPIVT